MSEQLFDNPNVIQANQAEEPERDAKDACQRTLTSILARMLKKHSPDMRLATFRDCYQQELEWLGAERQAAIETAASQQRG